MRLAQEVTPKNSCTAVIRVMMKTIRWDLTAINRAKAPLCDPGQPAVCRRKPIPQTHHLSPANLSKIVWIVLLLLSLSACQIAGSDDDLSGRVTLWHKWSPEEAVVLDEALAEFQVIHPDARVATVALPEDEILDEFIDAGNDGLGPGMLLADDAWIGDLVEKGLIRPLSPDESLDSFYDSRNRTLVQYDGQLYGIPLSLAPEALYYNTALVDTLPENLDGLLQEAADGKPVGFVPRFEEAYWGIQAFGEGLFDSDGHFQPAESGFLDWLAWLHQAQSEPGVVLSVDDQSLRELFASGRLAYYIAGPQERELIQALVDEENPLDFAVAPLPEGPAGKAGPLLNAETILLYAYDSPQQARIAEALALFLVNQQQSIRFMRELKRVPANPAVRVDQHIYPRVSGFAQQARSAVAIPNEIPANTLKEAGDLAYASVLSDLSTPAEALCQFSLDVAASLGPQAGDVQLPDGCES